MTNEEKAKGMKVKIKTFSFEIGINIGDRGCSLETIDMTINSFIEEQVGNLIDIKVVETIKRSWRTEENSCNRMLRTYTIVYEQKCNNQSENE